MDRRDGVRDITYRELAEQTARFANLLARLGVRPGERVFTLLGRVPKLYVAALGTLKARAVLSPLLAFGPEPVRERMRLGEAVVLVTTPQPYRRTVAPVRVALPQLRHVLLVGRRGAARPRRVGRARRILDRRRPSQRGRAPRRRTHSRLVRLCCLAAAQTTARRLAPRTHTASDATEPIAAAMARTAQPWSEAAGGPPTTPSPNRSSSQPPSGATPRTFCHDDHPS